MKRGRIRPRSARRAAEPDARTEVCRAALDRDRGCLAAFVVTEVACAGPLDVDEWDSRAQRPGGHLILDNVQVLCRAHHDWKHAHPIEAAHYGLRPYPRGYLGPEASERPLLGARRRDRATGAE